MLNDTFWWKIKPTLGPRISGTKCDGGKPIVSCRKRGSIGSCWGIKYPIRLKMPKRGSSQRNLPTMSKYGSTHPRGVGGGGLAGQKRPLFVAWIIPGEEYASQPRKWYYNIYLDNNISCDATLSGFISSVSWALSSKLRSPGFKSWPGTVGGLVTIIMWGARPGWKLALS